MTDDPTPITDTRQAYEDAVMTLAKSVIRQGANIARRELAVEDAELKFDAYEDLTLPRLRRGLDMATRDLCNLVDRVQLPPGFDDPTDVDENDPGADDPQTLAARALVRKMIEEGFLGGAREDPVLDPDEVEREFKEQTGEPGPTSARSRAARKGRRD